MMTQETLREAKTIADALWDAKTALSIFEDELYDRLGGDAVDPFSHIGHDCYDRSIEIYDLREGIALSEDDRVFIHSAGFDVIYHDRKGNPDLAVKMRRAAIATMFERLRTDLDMAVDLIQEAKGYEGPSGGPVTDHLDAAETHIDRVLAQFEKEQQP